MLHKISQGTGVGDNLFQKLISLDGIGDSIAHDFIIFFSDEFNLEIINGLLSEIKVSKSSQIVKKDSEISNKIIVFTGTLMSKSRAKAKEEAILLGARVSDSLSKKTDFLVIGKGAGSKEIKAKNLGVTILTEIQYQKLIS